MYTRVWEEIKKVINKVINKVADTCSALVSTSRNKLDDFSKDYSVIMFESDDDVNSMINIRSLTIIIRSVLCKDNNFYPQIYLNYCSYDKL